jgi:signal transduction histidine kinase
MSDVPERLPGERSLNIYRIVQESLNNVAKHAAASRIRIEIGMHGKRLRASIIDDGRGFDPREAGRGETLGLAGMRERAALIEGHVNITSEIGRGTEVVLEVPLQNDTEDP